jgi:alpha-tubulin suppressor-like RCC1 family protein
LPWATHLLLLLLQILPRQVVLGLGRRAVASVAAAKHHTLVVTQAGEVFSFGSNKDGRLGYAAIDNQPTPRK